jgi:hypothetical protein
MSDVCHAKRSCRWLAAGILTAGALVCLPWSTFQSAEHASAAEPITRGLGPRQSIAATASGGSQREREGTNLVDVPGYFKLTGDRATFFPAGGETHYLALENLNLERIAAAISDIPEQVPWRVSGTVTEYRGANFLLVTKAILQNGPAAPIRPINSAEPPAAPRATQAY